MPTVSSRDEALCSSAFTLCVWSLSERGNHNHSNSNLSSPAGLTDLIRTQRVVTAAAGEEARLSCQLVQFKDVVQVTWKKLLSKGEKILASCAKEFCQRVNPDFKDKVEFADAGLQSSSIIIRNVTEQDEGCYHCLFNADPEGALTGTTCLQVYELHEPVLHVGDSNSEETVVSCSATGRPAPTVTLTVLRDDVHFSDPVSVSNTNGTVTVTSTAVLTRLHDDSTEVRCAVRVLSGPQKEKIMMIPAEVKQSADGFNEESAFHNRSRNVSLVIILNSEGIKIDNQTTEDTQD
ncbi:OX-2 membrane glycoprotein-like [Pagrus major]|uniref:OX-2 membrane glycoprotein-like n=1 Tax=Pagrus major TaxID=143350 RepID=UPI003CC89E4D